MVRVRGGSKAGQLLRDRLPKWQNQRTARRENHDDDDDGDDSIVVLGDRPGFGTKHLETPGAAAPSPSHVKGKSSATQEASTSKSKPSLEVHIAKGASKRRKRREASVIPESDHEDVTPTQSRPHPTQPVTPRTELPSPSTTQPALRDSSKRCQPKTPVYHRLATPPLPQEPGKRRKRVRSPQPAQPAKRRRHADHASVAETVVGDQRAPANPVDLEDEIELIQVDVCAAADMDEDEDRTTVQPEDKDVMADGVAGGAAVDRSEDDDKAALHAELKQLRMRLERLDQEVADRQRVERERDQERTNRELGEVLLDTAEKVIDDTTRELRARITAGNMVTDDLRGMTMKYDKLKEELRGKTSECDKLKGELHGQTVEFDKLEEQFHRNSIRRHELEASLRRKADEFKEFEEEVTRLQEVNARDREMLKRLESLLTSETAQHRQTKNDLDTRTAEFATVKTELQNRVRAAEAHSKGTERERQDLVRRAKDHETKWKSFEVRARQTERDLNKARHDIISLERKAQTLADKVAKASNQCGIEKRRADQLQDELDAAKTRQLETEDQRVSDAARLESEKQRAEELETALNVAKTLQVETEVRRIETAARFEAVKQRADQLQKALDETKAQQVQSKAVQQDNIHGLSKELEEARKKIAAQRTAHEQEQLSLDEELRQRDVMVKDLEQQVERTRHKLTAAAARERQLQEDLEKSRQTESRSLQELRIQLEMRDKVLQDATERETRLRSDMAFYQKRAHDAQHEVSKLITQLKTQKNQLHEREEQLEHSHRLLRELGNASLMKDHELRKKDNRLEQMATELRERVQELVTSPHSCQVLTNQVSVLETQVQVAEGRVQRLESELSLVTTQGQQRKADGIQAGPRFADVELLLSLAQGHMESSQPEQVAVEMSSAYNSLRLERDEALKAREILFKARKETVDGAKARDEAQHAFKIRLTELLRERVQAVEGRDQALKDRDQALEIRDQALIIRDQALKIRDHALNDRDMAMAGERMIRKKLTSENQELAAALAQIAEDYHKLQTIQTLEKGRLAIEHEVQAEVIFAARQKLKRGWKKNSDPQTWSGSVPYCRFSGKQSLLRSTGKSARHGRTSISCNSSDREPWVHRFGHTHQRRNLKQHKALGLAHRNRDRLPDSNTSNPSRMNGDLQARTSFPKASHSNSNRQASSPKPSHSHSNRQARPSFLKASHSNITSHRNHRASNGQDSRLKGLQHQAFRQMYSQLRRFQLSQLHRVHALHLEILPLRAPQLKVSQLRASQLQTISFSRAFHMPRHSHRRSHRRLQRRHHRLLETRQLTGTDSRPACGRTEVAAQEPRASHLSKRLCH